MKSKLIYDFMIFMIFIFSVFSINNMIFTICVMIFIFSVFDPLNLNIFMNFRFYVHVHLMI
jgi:hypothetical protein